MKERPILFSGPMVRAIMEGRKTQTRRVVKPQPVFDGYWWSCGDYHCNREQEFRAGMPHFVKHSYGTVGDRLWVREAWAKAGEVSDVTEYRADNHDPNGAKWRPSIHMPRLASRITLEITGVRVERLQEISGPDCWAEGVEHGWDCERYGSVVECYRDLWQSINGPESWSANPWVWVIEFRRIEQC